MAGHTKGPWVFDGTLDRNDQPVVTAEHNVLIATVCHECVKPLNELKANAHLIAAAPEMYEALLEACEFIASEYGDPESQAIEGEYISQDARPIWSTICNVLARARGK